MPNDCLRRTPALVYLLFLVVSCCISTQTFAQNSISGKLIDSAGGAAVSGATVNVVGSAVSVKTGTDGSFTIAAKLNDLLSFSHVGYTPVTVTVQGYEPLVVQIGAVAGDLSDVVVVGYGRQKR